MAGNEGTPCGVAPANVNDSVALSPSVIVSLSNEAVNVAAPASETDSHHSTADSTTTGIWRFTHVLRPGPNREGARTSLSASFGCPLLLIARTQTSAPLGQGACIGLATIPCAIAFTCNPRFNINISQINRSLYGQFGTNFVRARTPLPGAPHPPFPIPHSALPTPCSPLRIPHSALPTPHSPLPL